MPFASINSTNPRTNPSKFRPIHSTIKIWADFHGNEAKKKFFFSKIKFKMADSKKAHFSESPILKNFSPKFLRWVLGLVGLNDVKGIDVALHI